MTIAEVWGKLKTLRIRPEWFMVALILLVGAGSFGLGRLSALAPRTVPIRVEEVKGWGGASVSTATRGEVPASSEPPEASSGGEVVGSKAGTKYHFPWCSGAQRIKEENKVRFSSIAEARAAGYEPAANCKGLE